MSLADDSIGSNGSAFSTGAELIIAKLEGTAIALLR